MNRRGTFEGKRFLALLGNEGMFGIMAICHSEPKVKNLLYDGKRFFGITAFASE
ncbi:MAG: hypothetical protein LBH96_04020 [Candidatus Peribacteria bacterium]|jgi:hypothetical protein|nr:hypothetical protein [Candidatus Peribacteria bacterium]